MLSVFRAARRFEGHARAAEEKIGYGESKRLASELLRRRHIDGLRHRFCIDGLGERGGRAHFLPPIALRRTWHIAAEPRDPRHDDFVAIRLVYAIAHAAANRHARETEVGQ
jgi:hypothetical protein